MNVNLFISLFLLSYSLAHDEDEYENRDTPNIRHGRSRSRLLRTSHHNDEEEYKFITNKGEWNVSSHKLNSNISTINNLESNKLDTSTLQINDAATHTRTVDESKSLRKITVDSNFNLRRDVLQKSMNQISEKHTDNGNYETKSPPKESKDYNINLPEVEESFIENNENDEVVEKITENVKSGQVDIVTRFLRIVESQHLLGENCTAGTDLNLGEGVVDRYAQERFRIEADVAVNRANMLTRLWKYAEPSVFMSEYLLHASVFSMVEFDNDIFAAGNCYDQYQYKDYWLFCPYAYRLPEGTILVKDLAVEYKYLSNTSEWFYIARKNAENVIRNYNQFSRGMYCNYLIIYTMLFRFNFNNHSF